MVNKDVRQKLNQSPWSRQRQLASPLSQVMHAAIYHKIIITIQTVGILIGSDHREA